MNPAIPTIIETLGKDGILAVRADQNAVLAEADRIEALAKASRPRTTARKVHQSAAAVLRTIALDSRFFLDHEAAMEDARNVQSSHDRLADLMDRHPVDRRSLSIFAGLDLSVWNLVAGRYPDEEGIRA